MRRLKYKGKETELRGPGYYIRVLSGDVVEFSPEEAKRILMEQPDQWEEVKADGSDSGVSRRGVR